MQGTASRLLAKFKQGTVVYYEPGAPTGDPWNPTPGAETPHVLDATVSGVSEEYVDGATVEASDLMISAAVFGTTPTMDGRFEIDGKSVEMIRVRPKPAAGTTVAWSVVVRG